MKLKAAVDRKLVDIAFLYRIGLPVIAMLLVLSACASENELRPSGDAVDYATSVAELSGIRFLSGRPLEGDTLEKSVSEPVDTQMKNMQNSVQLLSKYRNEVVSIVGHTDNLECAESGCLALSLRRAKLVRKWLIDRGVGERQLRAGLGSGQSQPISINDTEDGRANNRRVEIDLLD